MKILSLIIFIIGFTALNCFIKKKTNHQTKITHEKAEIRAAEIADKTIESIHIVKNATNCDGTVISSNINLNQKEKLNQMKKAGIKKVELLCIDDCDCCKDFKDKQIPINKAVALPRKDCPLERCRGTYTPVVEFDF